MTRSELPALRVHPEGGFAEAQSGKGASFKTLALRTAWKKRADERIEASGHCSISADGEPQRRYIECRVVMA